MHEKIVREQLVTRKRKSKELNQRYFLKLSKTKPTIFFKRPKKKIDKRKSRKVTSRNAKKQEKKNMEQTRKTGRRK